MNKKLIVLLSSTVLLVSPITIGAINLVPQPAPAPTDVILVDNIINSIVGFIWPIFGAFAILMFIIAGFTYLTAHGEPSKISLANKSVIWGIVGLAVAMLSTAIPWIVLNILGI